MDEGFLGDSDLKHRLPAHFEGAEARRCFVTFQALRLRAYFRKVDNAAAYGALWSNVTLVVLMDLVFERFDRFLPGSSELLYDVVERLSL